MSSSKMHVCLLCPGGLEYAGGIGRVIGYILDVWRNQPDAPSVVLIDTRGTGHIAFSPIHFALALMRILWLAVRGRATLLHVNLASRGSALRKFIATEMAHLLRIPVLIHLHGAKFDIFYDGLPSCGKSLVRRMFMNAARVVVLGASWRDFVVGQLGVPREKVTIIYNGVPEPARPSARSAPGPCHILFLGRLGARKGVPELLRALASPGLATLSWRATFAGDGEGGFFRSEAVRLGLAQRIDFTGWVCQSKVDQLLADADILALPSHQEGLPVAILEAMAHRVAVVTTPVGAIPEVLANGISSVLVRPGDEQGLAEAIIRLIEDDGFRNKIAEGGHDAFRRHFNVVDTAQRIRAVYAAMVGAAPSLPSGLAHPGKDQSGKEDPDHGDGVKDLGAHFDHGHGPDAIGDA